VASKFKSQLLEEFGVASDGTPPLGKFIKADVIDSQYIVGCDLMSKIEPFKPGQVEEETLAWDVGAPRGVPLESGEIRLTATFASEGFKLEAETGVTLEQGVSSGLTIVDYIDSALGNDEFEAWLSDHPPTTWINGMLAFWPTEQGGMPNFEPYTSAKNGAVDVGMFADSQGAGYGGVVLDPLTGAVLGTRFGNPDHHGTQPTATPAPY